jgi:hypothetical protein
MVKAQSLKTKNQKPKNPQNKMNNNVKCPPPTKQNKNKQQQQKGKDKEIRY